MRLVGGHGRLDELLERLSRRPLATRRRGRPQPREEADQVGVVARLQAAEALAHRGRAHRGADAGVVVDRAEVGGELDRRRRAAHERGRHAHRRVGVGGGLVVRVVGGRARFEVAVEADDHALQQREEELVADQPAPLGVVAGQGVPRRGAQDDRDALLEPVAGRVPQQRVQPGEHLLPLHRVENRNTHGQAVFVHPRMCLNQTPHKREGRTLFHTGDLEITVVLDMLVVVVFCGHNVGQLPIP
ncbi:hypothetical protein [Phytohabitans suffuscus]|uniref:hypothetical protein n=1 Tax=Phytohabitans suffuscus TaxID=624315 RepID=UPI0015642A3B